MPDVVVLCGPVGAGKSTVAAALERRGLQRLSLDDVAWRAGYHEHPLPREGWLAVHREVCETLVALVGRGSSVVLDTAAPFRSERDDHRRVLRPLGVVPLVAHVHVPVEVATARVRLRGGAGPDDLHLDDATVVAYHDGFEAPTPDEGPVVAVDGTASPDAAADEILTALGEGG